MIFASLILAASMSTGTLNVITANCLEDLHATPVVSYLKMNNRSMEHFWLHGPTSLNKDVAAAPRQLAPGMEEFTLRLPTGNYEIYVRAGKCFGTQAMAGVLAGHTRSLSVRLAGDLMTMMFDHDHIAVAGTVPMPGARLEFVAANYPDRDRFVSIEDGAFYVDSLQRMQWLLKVWIDCCHHADFAVDLSGLAAGDFVNLNLTADDVLQRLGYNGQLFSDPEMVASSDEGAWYLNPGRNAIGFARPDGTHNEMASPSKLSVQSAIIGDGSNGAWVTFGKRLGHVRPDGTITMLDIGGGVRDMLRGPRELVVRTSEPNRILRITDSGIARIDIPSDLDLWAAGITSDGTIVYNVSDTGRVARLDGNALSVVIGKRVVLSPDVTLVDDGLALLAQPSYHAIHVGYTQQRGWESESGFGTISDGHGGMWVTICGLGGLRHVHADGVVKSVEGERCDESAIPDGNGGIWMRGSHRDIWHIGFDDVKTVYTLANSMASIGNLSRSSAGEIWFPELGANKVGLLKNGHITEIDLGNAGATPHLTVVP